MKRSAALLLLAGLAWAQKTATPVSSSYALPANQLNAAPYVQVNAGAPTSLACNTAGVDLAFDSTNLDYYVCVATGTPGKWALLSAPETFTVGTGGVTANTLVQTDTSNPAKVLASTTGVYGVALSTVSSGGSVKVARWGQVPCVTDTGGATAGDLVVIGTGTVADCKDAGITASTGISVSTRRVGVFLTSATAGSTAIVELTPSSFGSGIGDGDLPKPGTGGGTAQAQTATLTFAPTLASGLPVCWLPANNNTGAAPTLAVNGTTAKPITKLGTAALVANDLTTTAYACALYDGTEYQLQNPQTTASGGSGTGLPLTSTVGTMVGGLTTGGTGAFFSATKTTCTAGGRTFWPVAGWFVSPTIAYNAAQVTNGYTFPFTSCGYGGAQPPYLGTGVLTTSANSAAGSSVDTYQYDGWHAGVGSQVGIGEISVTGPSGLSAAFVADSGNAVTVFGTAIQVALTASSTQFLGFGGTSYSATEMPVAIPVPVAGAFQNFVMCDSTNPSNSVAVNFRANGASVGTPGNVGFTLPAASAGCNGWDATNSYTASVGDYVDIQTVSGGTNQTNINWAAIGFTPTSGTPEIIWGLIDNTVSTTTIFSAPMTLSTGTTEANVEMAMPRACSASNLYMVLATTEGATQTVTVTLRVNGATPGTTLTGTIAINTTASVVAIDTTHTVSLAQGDRIDISYVTNSGTSGTLGGWAFKCQ